MKEELAIEEKGMLNRYISDVEDLRAFLNEEHNLHNVLLGLCEIYPNATLAFALRFILGGSKANWVQAHPQLSKDLKAIQNMVLEQYEFTGDFETYIPMFHPTKKK